MIRGLVENQTPEQDQLICIALLYEHNKKNAD